MRDEDLFEAIELDEIDLDEDEYDSTLAELERKLDLSAKLETETVLAL